MCSLVMASRNNVLLIIFVVNMYGRRIWSAAMASTHQGGCPPEENNTIEGVIYLGMSQSSSGVTVIVDLGHPSLLGVGIAN